MVKIDVYTSDPNLHIPPYWIWLIGVKEQPQKKKRNAALIYRCASLTYKLKTLTKSTHTCSFGWKEEKGEKYPLIQLFWPCITLFILEFKICKTFELKKKCKEESFKVFSLYCHWKLLGSREICWHAKLRSQLRRKKLLPVKSKKRFSKLIFLWNGSSINWSLFLTSNDLDANRMQIVFFLILPLSKLWTSSSLINLIALW